MRQMIKSIGAFTLIIFLATGCKKEYITNIIAGPAPVVEAGNSQTIQLPTNSVELAGTVTKSSSKIVGYLWSQVSGPNTPKIANESSTTTEINGLVEGKYIFQFLAIDSAGLTGVDTLSVTVKPSPIKTIALQPANNPYDICFGIWGTGDYTNPNLPEFSATAWTRDGILVTLRGAFKFDLSEIPANATIISAKLSLFSNPTPINGDLINANSGTNNSMYLQRITGNWNSSSKWSTQPSVDAASQISIPHTNLTDLDLIDLNVTSMINTMHTTNNYGFMIRLQNESIYNGRNFSSSRHTDSTKRPKLEITYKL